MNKKQEGGWLPNLLRVQLPFGPHPKRKLDNVSSFDSSS